MVAGPGFAPGFRDYEPRVVTPPPPRGVYTRNIVHHINLFGKNDIGYYRLS